MLLAISRLRIAVAFLAASLIVSPASASSGDRAFLELNYASAGADLAAVAAQFSVLKDTDGRTLLPAGTVCDSVEVSGTVLTARFTFAGKAPELAPLDVESVEAILRKQAGAELTAVYTFARADGEAEYRPLSSFIPPPPPIPDTGKEIEPGMPPGVPGPDYQKLYRELQQPAKEGVVQNVAGQGPVGTSGQPQGALSGRTVYFSAGHGWVTNDARTGWGLERPLILSMNEDHGNIDQVNFFAQYLFNAGATVVCMRPLGYQTREVVVDGPTATTGAWTGSTSADNYGSGTPNAYYATPALTETATATFTPNIPLAGFYPVYCYANYGTNRASGQLYKVRHTGGESQVRVNHRRVGRGWVWLGNYYFNAGSNAATGSVVVSNLMPSGFTGTVVMADAIRFGNGMGDSDTGAGVSGRARETECSRYWLYRSEAPASVYDSSTTDGNDNISAPPRMAAYMRNDDGQGYNGDIFLGFHSNAAGTLSRGSVGLITTSGTPNPPVNQPAFATLVSDEIDNDGLVEDANWPYTWHNNASATYTSAYGEISNNGLDEEMTGTIIEVAYHDNASDAVLLRDPRVRNVIARACYQAIVRYFNTYDGGTLAFLPEPPVRLKAVNTGGGTVALSWQPGPSGGAGGGAATGYRVYRSTNGLSFDTGAAVAGTSTNVTGLSAGQTYYFRVAATNAGGESMPTEVVCANVLDHGTVAPTLIVNGYDRLDRYNDVPEFPGNPADSRCDRVLLRRNNSYDYVIEHAKAIEAASSCYRFDSCSNEAVISNDINLNNYSTVIWICGEEATEDDTLDATERSKLQTFLNAGGKSLFISGAEIGYELDGTAVDASFYNNYLRADYTGAGDDDAGTYLVTGNAGSIFNGITMDFSPDADMYDVDYPDILHTINGSTSVATYGSGETAIDNFESIGTWKDPNDSGSSGGADSSCTFSISSAQKHQGSYSGAFYYSWGTATQIREYNSSPASFSVTSPFSIWVYGDNSGHNFRVLVRDGDSEIYYRTAPMTLNFTGWQQFTWNIQTDSVRWFGSGDGVFTGTTGTFDSMLLQKVTATNNSTIYVDQAATLTGSGGNAAVVQYSGAYKLLNFGFPFEAINSATARGQVMGAALTFFGTPCPVGLSEFVFE